MSAKRGSALLALTLGAAPLLISTTAQAAESTCGQPAKPAVFRTVTVPAVDASYGTDLQWSRTVEDQAAYTEYGWTRQLAEYAYTDYEWVRHVVDQVYVPAVPGVDAVTHTEYRWPVLTRQDQYRWPVLTRSFVPGTAAVPEVGHYEYLYQRQVVDQPEQVIEHPAVTHEEVHPAVTHVETVIDPNDPTPYAYYQINRPSRIKYEASLWNNGDADADSGWARYPAGDKTIQITVVDKEAWTQTVVDEQAWTQTIPATYKTESQWSATDPGGDWTLVPGQSRYVVTQQAAPAVPDGYTDWTASGYTDWGSSTTPPQATDTVMYGTLEHGYTDWQSTGATDWQQSPTAPTGGDLTSYGQVETRTVEDTPAVPGTPEVPEKSHDETQWSTSPTVSPWAGSDNEGSPTGETAVVTQDSYVPLSAPYLATGAVRDLDPATDLGWTSDEATPPAGDGWQLTGQQVEHDAVTHAETAWTVSGQTPDGDGWTATGASRQGDLVAPAVGASTHRELLSAAVPAGPACAAEAADPADPADPAPAAKPSRAASAVPASLAFTGFDPALYAAGGMVLIVAGSGLTLAARRRRD